MEYQKPIQIEANDPICSASGLQGTVIGILFEKKGSEIQTAIGEHTKVIDKEISKYDKITGEVKDFLKKKEEEIKKIEKIYTDRKDKKEAKAKPHERQMQEIQKQWSDEVFIFDKETEKNVAKEAVDFEKGFEQYEEIFEDIDKIIEEEQQEGVSRSLLRTKSALLSSAGNTAYNNVCEDGSITFAGSALAISETEDKALARLNTLKSLVREYAEKVRRILGKVDNLKEEQRRLNLICKNIEADSKYKLDLNKLSAFGFENVAIA